MTSPLLVKPSSIAVPAAVAAWDEGTERLEMSQADRESYEAQRVAREEAAVSHDFALMRAKARMERVAQEESLRRAAEAAKREAQHRAERAALNRRPWRSKEPKEE